MAKLRADGGFEDLSMTRRHALGAMGVGFALSMRPVSAETIVTDAKGLEVEDVKFKVADGMSPAYVARPKGKGPFPTILLNSEIFGLHEWSARRRATPRARPATASSRRIISTAPAILRRSPTSVRSCQSSPKRRCRCS